MLQPKKAKYRKQFKGRARGTATNGTELAFGDFALKAVSTGRITSGQIEAARKKITFMTKRAGKYWIRIFPQKPVTTKPVGVKMGGGKGAIDTYVAVVRAGTVLFELAGVTEEVAHSAFSKAGHKLSVKTTFIQKQ